MPAAAPVDIDAYIAEAPPDVRPVLTEIRRVVRAAAPDAEERISYRMPAFMLHGVLLYFAAFKNHIGIYPPVSGDARLEAALAPFLGPKRNLKFPLDRPIPYPLIGKIVRLRVKQNLARATVTAKRPRSGKTPPKIR